MQSLRTRLSFEENSSGRDFVVGDIHGHVELLFKLLSAVSFDYSTDRLFAVGDLIDRGPHSYRALQLTKEPWFFSCLGNHELFLLESGQQGAPSVQHWRRNGGEWFFWLSKAEQADLRAIVIEKMAVSISLQFADYLIGIIHAAIPADMNWWDLAARTLNLNLLYKSVWDRRYWLTDAVHSAPGVNILFCGHTPGDGVRHTGNIINLDTGAANISSTLNRRHGQLTLCEISSTLIFSSCDYTSLSVADKASTI